MLCATTTHLLGGKPLGDVAQLPEEPGHCLGAQPVASNQYGLHSVIWSMQLLLSLQQATATWLNPGRRDTPAGDLYVRVVLPILY